MTLRQLKILLALLLINILYVFLLGKFIRNSSIDLHKVSSIKGEISEIESILLSGILPSLNPLVTTGFIILKSKILPPSIIFPI